QELLEILLETIRKGYWNPDKATVLEIATAYARSVARHGEGGGLRGGGNVKLEAFVEKALLAPGDIELRLLLEEYAQKRAGSSQSASTDETRADVGITEASVEVEGPEMTEVGASEQTAWLSRWKVALLLLMITLLVALGYGLRRGIPYA
ncbi:MAG: cobaltochelatase subunit CobN, partial [Planctomycetota bacterium]